MSLSKVAQSRYVTGDIAIQIGLRQRRLVVVVVGAERCRKTAAPPCLVLECVHQGAANSLQSPVPRHHDRMQLPDTPAIFFEAAHPPKDLAAFDRGAHESILRDPLDL